MFGTKSFVILITVHQIMIEVVAVKMTQLILVKDFMELFKKRSNNEIGHICIGTHESRQLRRRTRVGSKGSRLFRLIGDEIRTKKNLADTDDVSFR